MPPAPETRFHQEWIGYLQPVGLVVSPPALVAAQCFPNRNIAPLQLALKELVEQADPPCILDFPTFSRDFLAWEPRDLAGAPAGPELPRALDVALTEYGEVLSPTYAVPDPDNAGRWLLLVKVYGRTEDLDEVAEVHRDGTHWHASPQARFERLLRENDVPAGLLVDGTHVRLVYAPRGESSGHVTFPVDAMCEVAGRPIVSALHMLLSAERLFTLPTKQRLPALLKDSRRYQNEVSTRLAEQVLDALHELLRGFQAANEATRGELLKDVLREAPQDVYGGLLGTLLRLVFVLYAEDRGLLGNDAVYQEHYSVIRLFERLRDDAARYPDTMEQRYGAWAQLVTLFRLIHDGASHGAFHLPPRHGHLFDPDTWDFLEGRPYQHDLTPGERLTNLPRVSDGVVHRVLENLLVLDGDRVSYRALDVEQIGSVYEAMMGFELRLAAGASIAVRPDHVVVDVDDLLHAKPADRVKRLADEANLKLTGAPADAVKAAATPDDVVAALGKKVSPRTPQLVPKGGIFLQPTEERRRSGSHYTPRSLTEPIVRTTLEPVLKNLGPKPRPEQILDLKVCDPAMGSGAFLVEASRLLGEALVQAWQIHGGQPAIPPDEEPLLHARRLVAQRCLYGVDKNPFAVDLAKLSLWLATLARDHSFTFLDHALRHGDSLVGLSKAQIESFNWAPKQKHLISDTLRRNLKAAEDARARLHAMGDSDDFAAKQKVHEESREYLKVVRAAGDLVIAAFFAAEKDKEREARRLRNADLLKRVLEDDASPADLDAEIDPLYRGPRPVPPFHWEIEFPEVFSRDNPGFDAFVGNPPFAGVVQAAEASRAGYTALLRTLVTDAGGKCDLAAFFFRKAFSLIRRSGTMGFVATNTIAQGDTRDSGLTHVCEHGGRIFEVRKRIPWPGAAAVIVSRVHIAKDQMAGTAILDGKPVQQITAFLLTAGGHRNPACLRPAGVGLATKGVVPYGMGFTFDDENPDTTPTAEARRLLGADPRNALVLRRFLGGADVNSEPTHTPERYIISFGAMEESEARSWPDLMRIVEQKVRPTRMTLSHQSGSASLKRLWWQFGYRAQDLVEAKRHLPRVLVCSQTSKYLAFAFAPSDWVFDQKLIVFANAEHQFFGILQSRVHEAWALMFGSTMKDDPVYTPPDCFETFPFPAAWETDRTLEAVGREYYHFRAALMVSHNEGLTKIYNRFHDPEERDPDILKLRDLHDAMDRAVLDAYGWTDIRPTCTFLLDYEDEEDEDAPVPGKKGKKKPWRYRWPDEVRDEVLARLLALNKQRADEEASLSARSDPGAGASRSRRRPRGASNDGDLFT